MIRHVAVERRHGGEDETQKVLDIVISAECRPDGSPAFSERIPGQTDPRAEQPPRIVLGQGGMPDQGLGLDHAPRVVDEIGGSSGGFVPTIRKLVAQTEPETEVGPHLDRVLEKPGTFELAPRVGRRIWHDSEVRDCALEKGLQARKDRLPVHARSSKLVGAKPLKAHAGAQLVAAADHLDLVRVGEQAFVIVEQLPGRAASGSDAADDTTAADGPADGDVPRRAALDQREAVGKGNQGWSIEVEAGV